MVSFGKSKSRNQSYVWDEQSPFLQNLYQTGQNLYDQTSGSAQTAADGFLNRYMPQLNTTANKFKNMDYAQYLPDGINLGMTTLSNMMDNQVNPYLETQVENLWDSIGTNLKENILPAQRSEASVLGGYGDSRDRIAEGMAMKQAIKSGSDAETNLRFSGFESGQNRALTAADVFSGRTLDESKLGLTAQGMEADAMKQFPEMVNNMYNLGMSAQQLPWQDLYNYQKVIGAPTILGQGSSGGVNFGFLNG